MPTIIDSLLVTLGLDNSDFKRNSEKSKKMQDDLEDSSIRSTEKINKARKKANEEEKKRAKEAAQRSKNVAQALSKVRNEALGLAAILTGGVGLKSFIAGTISTEAALSRMSSNLGMSAKDLAAYRLANVQAGGSAEGMVNQLKSSAEDIARLKLGLGPSEGMQAFFRYGGSYKDLQDGNTYLRARADIIAKMYKESPTKAMAVAQAMGVDEDTFNLMKRGSHEIDILLKSQEGLALAQARNADKAELLRQKFVAVQNQLAITATDILSDLMPAMNQFGDWISSHKDEISGFMQTFVHLVELSAKGWKNIYDWSKAATEQVPTINKKLGIFNPLNEMGKKMDEFLGLKNVWGSGEGEATAPAKEKNSSLPRNLRNRNPGNIEYGAFARAHGATGSDGRFAVFPDMATGEAAQRALLSSYMNEGKRSVSSIVSKWAPGKENNTAAYIRDVSRQLGVSATQPLGREHIPLLATAMARHEGAGAAYGLNMPSGAGVGIGSATTSTSTSTSDVKIGEINIKTEATDAAGIAKSIGGAVAQYSFVPQANTGMT